MKITEEITRECCDTGRDMERITCSQFKQVKVCKEILKCKHCGKLWVSVRRADAAGGMESAWVEVKEAT